MSRVPQPANEQVELRQSRRQMVVQNNQPFLFGGAGMKRAFHPTLRIVPIARDDVPQHAREFLLDEVVAGGAAQETAVEVAASAKRAEEAVSMGQRADKALCGSDFPFGQVRSAILSQWGRVCVIE